MSRIMLDIYLEEAIGLGLIRRHPGDSSLIVLEAKGKHYAIQHKLIK